MALDAPPLTGAALDQALRDNVKTVVVIYAENRSFNNLFGNFPGVEKPMADLDPVEYQQRDRDGKVLEGLPPVWGGVL
ncbi:alkaline phosphatase family protein, partial [Glaciimonas sp. Cout2]|uniref:alkaline phosphatase family protein n=1 Tax=Glaciimonas sp. Cout2 TaxID=3048621 RepID=UPI002B225EDA